MQQLGCTFLVVGIVPLSFCKKCPFCLKIYLVCFAARVPFLLQQRCPCCRCCTLYISGVVSFPVPEPHPVCCINNTLFAASVPFVVLHLNFAAIVSFLFQEMYNFRCRTCTFIVTQDIPFSLQKTYPFFVAGKYIFCQVCDWIFAAGAHFRTRVCHIFPMRKLTARI